MDSGLLRWQPFKIWGGPHVSLGGVPCTPLPPTTLLSRGLIARIQKRIFLGCTYAMGFDWQHRTLLLLMEGILALRCLHPLGAPLFRRFDVLVGVFILLLSFSSSSWGVFILLLSFSSSSWGALLLLLSCWDYEGHGGIVGRFFNAFMPSL